MLNRLIGRATATSMLKDGLDVSSMRARQIAHRVANASAPASGFSGVMERVGPGMAGTPAAAVAGAGQAGDTGAASVAGTDAAGPGDAADGNGAVGAGALEGWATDTIGAEEGVDLETEMVALADEQLRYEAMTRLLSKVYAQVRSAIRER
jgi:hypothetical protein